MQITINIPDSKLYWLLALLNEIPDVMVQVFPVADDDIKLADMAGIWEQKMTMEEIDKRLQEQKDEWL